MAKHTLNKKEMAKKAFTAKLARFGVQPSAALNYKKQTVVLSVGAERGRIIQRDELKKLRQKNLQEGPVSKLLDKALTIKETAKKKKKKGEKGSDESSSEESSSEED